MAKTARKPIALATIALLVAGLVPFLVGPVSAQDPTATAASDATQESTGIETKLRFLHASPSEDDAVKISINGDKRIDDVAYGELSDYADTDTGDVWVKIEQVGALDLFDVLYSAVYPVVPPGNYYQMVMTDDLVIANVVDRSPLPEGKARIRFIQASPGLPTADIIANGESIALVTKLNYPHTSDYVLVDPGMYDLKILQSGTQTTLLEVSGTSVEAGKVYDVFLIGNLGDEPDRHPLEAVIGTTETAS